MCRTDSVNTSDTTKGDHDQGRINKSQVATLYVFQPKRKTEKLGKCNKSQKLHWFSSDKSFEKRAAFVVFKFGWKK